MELFLFEQCKQNPNQRSQRSKRSGSPVIVLGLINLEANYENLI